MANILLAHCKWACLTCCIPEFPTTLNLHSLGTTALAGSPCNTNQIRRSDDYLAHNVVLSHDVVLSNMLSTHRAAGPGIYAASSDHPLIHSTMTHVSSFTRRPLSTFPSAESHGHSFC